MRIAGSKTMKRCYNHGWHGRDLGDECPDCLRLEQEFVCLGKMQTWIGVILGGSFLLLMILACRVCL